MIFSKYTQKIVQEGIPYPPTSGYFDRDVLSIITHKYCEMSQRKFVEFG